MTHTHKTIAAIATPPGEGAIATIRITGKKSLDICNKIFKPYKKHTNTLTHNTTTLGEIHNQNQTIDQTIVTYFKAPQSFTGEDTIEISCHGSTYIQQKILETLIQHGASLAQPGEFTKRAFLNGKMDLSQAEAIADLIAAKTQAQNNIAIKQIKGNFTNQLQELRQKMLTLTSLIELELDFSEEDVEFADRKELTQISQKIETTIKKLTQTFTLGNAIKTGIPVAIVGNTNAGKSTLLNKLINEERAIVSNIHGTTRDTIEETINIKGYPFRLIDTAGIRKTKDQIENIGIQRTYQKIEQAQIIILLIDINDNIETIIETIKNIKNKITHTQQLQTVINKIDTPTEITQHLENNNTQQYNNINICGLMAMATNTSNTNKIENEFKTINNLYQKLKNTTLKHNKTFKHLSIGMSNDYPIAIKNNSTMIRIGSNIFGKKQQ